MANTLRASVTATAGGVNLCPNGSVGSTVDQYLATDNGGPDLPTLEWTTLLPSASPIGAPGCGLMTFTGPNTGGFFPAGLVIPSFNVLAGNTYTLSIYVYVPGDSTVGVSLIADGIFGSRSIIYDDWVRLSVTFTASADDPAMALWSDGTPQAGDSFYFGGCLIQPGSSLGVWTAGGGQEGDPVEVLVDGSDTPVTANGLTGYLPSPGDRLLVAKVGGMVEVLQFVSRGTVPYLVNADITDLAATVDDHTTSIDGLSTTTSAIDTDLQTYKGTTDGTISTLQSAYGALSGIGSVGVEEDYIWVGDDPALQTVKSVQISTYVQGGLYAGDSQTLGDYFDLWTKADIGDITFQGAASPPMTTFYNAFTALGLSALPWNA